MNLTISGFNEARAAVVPQQERHPLLRDVRQGGHQRRTSLSNYRQERTRTGSTP